MRLDQTLRLWSAAGGIAAERKLQTKIKECEGQQ